MKTTSLLQTTMCAICFFYSQTNAAVVLDQDSFTGQPVFSGVITSQGDPSFRRSQTFTSGVSGTLMGVDVQFVGDHLFFVEARILSTQNGIPTSTILSTSIFNLSTVLGPNGFIFDFSDKDFSITAGTTYALELVQSIAGDIFWTGGANQYDGGSSYFINQAFNIDNWTETSISDYGLRTYVQPVPLPGAMLLMVSGIVGLIGLIDAERQKKT